MDKTSQYYVIQKSDEEKRLVYGYCSTEAVDSQGETITLDAMKNAWNDFMKFANVREMHGNSAAGVVKSYSFDEKGVFIEVEVVDDSAWEKVKKGVYKGFSIGGKKLKDGFDKVTKTITGLKLTEISLVDRPANPEALITMYKMDDEPRVSDEQIEELLAKLLDSDKGKELIAAKVADELEKAAAKTKGQYGDVAYADTKNKKYPIDTAAHIRAAWSYINMPKNQKGYTAAEIKSIKDNIISAWKDKIDKDGPPSVAKNDQYNDIQKALYTIASDDPDVVEKGLYAVSQFADCLMSLSYLQSGACWESAAEQDDSPMPAKLADLVSQAGQLLLEMATEEVGELVASMKNPDGTPAVEILELMVKNSKAGEGIAKYMDAMGLFKAGARNSAADSKKIQAAHDLLGELGATCADMNKGEHVHDHSNVTALDLVKMEKMAGELGTLRKSFEDLNKAHETLQAEKDELQKKWDALPTEPKGALLVVSKEGDTQELLKQDKEVQVEPVLKADGSVDEVATEIKKIYAGGGRLVMGPTGRKN